MRMSPREKKITEGDLLPNATLALTTPPSMPRNFLSRRNLFHLIDVRTPGVTLVVAPSGYGKTTLIAEWANQNRERTFWASAGGTEDAFEFRNLVFQAVRNVIPDFAPWFKANSNISAHEMYAKFFEEIAALGEEYVFVLDNGSVNDGDANPLAQYMIDILPDNLHLIVIRRNAPESSYVRFAQRGNLNLISSSDLKFNKEESCAIAALNNLDCNDPEVHPIIDLANGWPVCVQMLSKNFSKGLRRTNFSVKMASPTEPLRILTIETLNSLDESELEQLARLAVLKDFDLETAQVILGKVFGIQQLNKIVGEGLFISVTESRNPTYHFNLIMREAILQIAAEKQFDLKSAHVLLVDHFLRRDLKSQALEHAYESSDYQKMHQLLKVYSREMSATGQGDELLRWARYAGDESPRGLLMRKTVALLGHVTNLNFTQAQVDAQILIHEANNSPVGDFLRKIANAALMYVNYSIGNFSQVDINNNEIFDREVISGDLENSDKIAMMRIVAGKAYLFEFDKILELTHSKAIEMSQEGVDVAVPYALNTIGALHLFRQGNYIQAFEMAKLAIAQAEDKSYVGIYGPFEAHLVMGRCYLEFSRFELAFESIVKARDLAREWKQWPFYFAAEGTLIRLVATMGDLPRATEMIRSLRQDFIENNISQECDWMLDMSEVYLRYVLKDFDRVEVLLKRVPETSFTQTMKVSLQSAKGKVNKELDFEKMPDKTPREKLSKLLAKANAVSDREKECSAILQEALNLGYEVGAYETFVTQNEKLTNVILAIAATQPTLYLEDLVRLITGRIKERHESTGSLKENLTSREIEIVKHLSTAKPISSIAKSLHISQNTIKTHLRNVYRKLEVDGRVSAVDKARELFLV